MNLATFGFSDSLLVVFWFGCFAVQPTLLMSGFCCKIKQINKTHSMEAIIFQLNFTDLKNPREKKITTEFM